MMQLLNQYYYYYSYPDLPLGVSVPLLLLLNQ
jgi:hypothetical protein